MHIKTIRVDGYGPWSNLTLEGISGGLNVFFGGPGTGKSTLRRFIRSILTGFGEAATSPQQATDHAVVGGTLTTQGPDGRWEISRYQDGTRQGRLILRASDGTQQDPSLLATIRQLPPTTFDCLLDVDFHGRPSLGRLLDAMTGGGLLQSAEPPADAPRHELPTGPSRSELHRALQAATRQLHEHDQSRAPQALAARRLELETDIQRLKDRLRNHDGGRHIGRQPLVDEVDRQTVVVRGLRSSLDALDAETDSLRRQPPHAAPRRTAPPRPAPTRTTRPATDKEAARLLRQLESLDEQVRRWRRVARDVEQRRETLRGELTQWEMNRARASAPPQSPRRRLATLEQQVTQLQDQLVRLESAARHGCACRETVERVGPLAEQLRQQLYLLCQDLTTQQRGLRHESIINELKQLRRCRLELATHVKRLTDRRQDLLQQYGRLDPAGLELFRRAEAGQCSCDHHDQYLESGRTPPAARSNLDLDLDSNSEERLSGSASHYESDADAERRLHRLDELSEQRRQLLTRLESAEIRLSEAQRRLDAWQPTTDSAELSEELATRQRQILALDRELEQREQQRGHLLREVERIERLLAATPVAATTVSPTTVVESSQSRKRPQLVELATSYLKQISSGKYVRIGGPGPEGLLWITSHDGQTYPHDVLGPQTYDQLYLSLRLAVADVLSQRGVRIPLVLDDPFLNFDVEQHPEVLQVLSTFSEGGHQVLVLTGDPAAARLLSQRDHLVRDLPQLAAAAKVESARPRQTVTTRRADWDPEEFPGELADRVRVEQEAERRRNQHAARQLADGVHVVERPWTKSREYLTRMLDGHAGSSLAAAAGGSAAEQADRDAVYGGNGESQRGNGAASSLRGTGQWRFYLETSSPIEDAPSIGRKMAEQLRGIGVTQVSDLLALSPKAAAAQLAHLTVPSETIRAWQAQAWLVCCVPHLRPYDARILVACGITDPDQLEQMEPRELLDRIEKFLVTREGQRIVQSGNDYELARISHWIRMARQTHQRRQPRRSALDAMARSHAAGAPVGPPKPHTRHPWSAPPVEVPRGEFAGEYLPLDGNAGPRLWEADLEQAVSAPRPPRGARPQAATTRDTLPAAGPDSGRDSAPTSPTPTTTSKRRRRDRSASDGRASSKKKSASKQRSGAADNESSTARKFYLNTSSPVVDAPAIGPQMARLLEEIGIHSVADLLTADPADTARLLDHRRVNSTTVRQWQAQSRLVCRVPHLRGHDAQLLVACGYSEPEQLRPMEPKELLAVIGPFAASAEGQRIVRSGHLPDLEEVTHWIRWAHQTRPLKAA